MSVKDVAKHVVDADPVGAKRDGLYLIRAWEEYGVHLNDEQKRGILACPSPWTLIRERFKVMAARKQAGGDGCG